MVARPALPASRDVHAWALASPQQLPRCGHPLPPWAYRRGPLSRRRCCCFGCCFSLRVTDLARQLSLPRLTGCGVRCGTRRAGTTRVSAAPRVRGHGAQRGRLASDASCLDLVVMNLGVPMILSGVITAQNSGKHTRRRFQVYHGDTNQEHQPSGGAGRGLSGRPRSLCPS